MNDIKEIKEILEKREEEIKLRIKLEEEAEEKARKLRPTAKQLADEFTPEAVNQIKQNILKNEINCTFNGGVDYLFELTKNLKELGFISIEQRHVDSFKSSDPDGGWADHGAYDYIQVNFQYSWQIKTK